MIKEATNHGNRKIPEINLQQSMISMLDQFSSPYVIKDLESRHVYTNMAAVNLLGLKNKSEMLGKSDIEIKSKLFWFDDTGQEYVRQDKQITQSGKRMTCLEIHPWAVDYPYIVNKIPFYNDDSECIGLCVFTENLELFTLSDFVKGNLPGSFLLNKPDHFFTERNCEVMFFHLQGISNKETAERLNLSPRTIENYMQTLYEKVGVTHFDDFMQFCVARDYHRYLPKRFIRTEHLEF